MNLAAGVVSGQDSSEERNPNTVQVRARMDAKKAAIVGLGLVMTMGASGCIAVAAVGFGYTLVYEKVEPAEEAWHTHQPWHTMSGGQGPEHSQLVLVEKFKPFEVAHRYDPERMYWRLTTGETVKWADVRDAVEPALDEAGIGDAVVVCVDPMIAVVSDREVVEGDRVLTPTTLVRVETEPRVLVVGDEQGAVEMERVADGWTCTLAERGLVVRIVDGETTGTGQVLIEQIGALGFAETPVGADG
ncbi:MAG: hypothetical protein AAGB34_08295 [Planctomycetota bacterium]